MRFALTGVAIAGAALVVGRFGGVSLGMAFGFFQLWAMLLLWRAFVREPGTGAGDPVRRDDRAAPVDEPVRPGV